MHRSRANPLLSGAIAAAVLLVVMVGIFALGVPGGPQVSLPWNHATTLHIQLADSQELAPHASVEVAGVKVGEVVRVEGQGNLALATIQITQANVDIHRDATVYLRAHGLFGPKYISIAPGTAGAQVVGDGGTIGVDRTVQPVNLDAILQALQSPEQQDLRTAITELGQAAAGRGDDFNQLLNASASFTKVFDTPLRALDAVSPQLSDMLVQNESFNNYFAQTPLDQLVANSEQTMQAFAANASHLESLLTNADGSLTQLDTILNGEPNNLATTIHDFGTQGGTIDKLHQLTYTLALLGANITGKEAALGSDPASIDVTSGIIGAITNIASAFIYSDPCPPSTGPPGSVNDNHCSVSPDGRKHYLQVRLFNFPPSANPNPTSSFTYSNLVGQGQYAGDEMMGLGSLIGA